MSAIPEVRRIEQDGEVYAASVLLVPRGEEVHGLPFLYNIAGPGWTHWGYTRTWQRAWANVKRATKRHRARMKRKEDQ